MSNITTATGDQLASALRVLGIDFIMGGTNAEESLHERPALLIAALAESGEARLRLSLIPLLLEHPNFAAKVQNALQNLKAEARLTLQCYYSAAFLLQGKYQTRLNLLIGRKPLLPDLFSREIGLQLTGDPEKDLQMLAKRHQALSGARVNWRGTYEHALQVWLKGLEIQKR